MGPTVARSGSDQQATLSQNGEVLAADPPTFTAAVPDWKPGDEIPLGTGRSLRVVAVRAGVLVVESESWDRRGM
jgi:hypothetical protein